MIDAIFPGCRRSISETGLPSKERKATKATRAAGFVIERLKEPEIGSISFRETMEHVGIKDAGTFSKDIRRHPAFLAEVEVSVIIEDGSGSGSSRKACFRRQADVVGFTPVS